MPIPSLHKRSYGYVDPDQDEPKRRRPRRAVWKSLLLLPFTLFRLIWRQIFFHKKRRQGNEPPRQWLKKAFRYCVLAGIFCFVFSAITIAWISRDLPNPNELTDRKVEESTKIYDRTGEHLLYEIFSDEKRTLVQIEEVPQYLIDGVIATEDKKFFDHIGVRPLSMARALFFGVFTSRRVGGTSTLTQQLVKNAILTNERTLTRKVKEVVLSLRLEQKYSKQQILQIYFNEIPYGSTNYGVEAASQSYFGKHVSDVTLAEAATLAGLPQAPTKFLNNPDLLKKRRNFVLQRMADEGYLTQEEASKAAEEDLVIKDRINRMYAPHFVEYILHDILIEKYGEAMVETGGLNVITTLDWDKQLIAEKVIQESGEKIISEAQANNAAMVSIDPKTGQILAMLGSRDYFNKDIGGNYNVVIDGRRQPGSSIKPIVYAAAFEKGFTPDTILYDVLTDFDLGSNVFQPKNYTLLEYGPVTMRQALQGSLNISAVQTMYLVSQEKTVAFANRLGYSTFNNKNTGLSLVIGGAEVKMLEHVNAFGTFANNGVRFEPVSILRVENNTGEILEEWKKEKGEQVIAPEIAATISHVLSDDASRAYIFGAGGVLTLPGRPVAVKTGTTDEFRDAWTVGYTPSLVTGVWVGNHNNAKMKAGATGGLVAAKLWNAFMKEALKKTAVESFPPLPPNTADKPVLKGSAGGKITLSVDKVTGKIATSSTPASYIEERTYVQPHSILHYVDKDNPRGPAPENPALDPQYTNWEGAIQSWITRMKEKNPDWNMHFEEPPTEYDDVHSLELIPTLKVISPAPGSTLASRNISIQISVSAPRGVSRVSYFIDNKHIGYTTAHPFSLEHFADSLEPGAHTLSIVVEDDVGNKIKEEVPFTLNVSAAPPVITWVTSEQTLSLADFPRTFLLNHNKKLDLMSEIRIYRKATNGSKQMIGTINDFSSLVNDQLTFTWASMPEKGEWLLSTEIVTKAGALVESGVMKIIIQ